MEEPFVRNMEQEMAQQMAGFQKLARARRRLYWVAVAAGFVVTAVTVSRQGTNQGYLNGLITLICGMAGVRLLTAPIGAVLWYRNWQCPACHRRLGVRVVEHCPQCNAKLFSRPSEGPDVPPPKKASIE